jgi:hypothetical protein
MRPRHFDRRFRATAPHLHRQAACVRFALKDVAGVLTTFSSIFTLERYGGLGVSAVIRAVAHSRRRFLAIGGVTVIGSTSGAAPGGPADAVATRAPAVLRWCHPAAPRINR